MLLNGTMVSASSTQIEREPPMLVVEDTQMFADPEGIVVGEHRLEQAVGLLPRAAVSSRSVSRVAPASRRYIEFSAT